MAEAQKENEKKKPGLPPRRYRIHYTGRLEDGSVFDTSREQEPLTVPIGQKRVIPGLEAALTDMQAGETKKVTIPPAKAYGSYREELLTEVPRDRFKKELVLREGQFLQLTNTMGVVTKVRVKALEEEKVLLDANHPLAGKTLIFDIEVLEII